MHPHPHHDTDACVEDQATARALITALRKAAGR